MVTAEISRAPATGAHSRQTGTARTVLQLLSLLAGADQGLRAGEVAVALGRSPSTAYHLLDTLCQEGFVVHIGHGAYCLSTEAAAMVPADRDRPLPDGLKPALDELFARTHKRVYLAVARSGHIVIPMMRGRQGMPLIPGLGERIGENAHALALGKVALSLLEPEALDRYIEHGLRRFTSNTIVAAGALRRELAAVRAGAVAVSCNEFSLDACCLALPVRGAAGRPVAALGLSMSARSFHRERDQLSAVLRDVVTRAGAAWTVSRTPASHTPSTAREEVPS